MHLIHSTVPRAWILGKEAEAFAVPFSIFKLLGMKPRFLYLLGKCFTSEPHPYCPHFPFLSVWPS